MIGAINDTTIAMITINPMNIVVITREHRFMSEFKVGKINKNNT